MNSVKKALAFLLVLCLAFGVAGCAQDEPQPTDSGTNATASPSPSPSPSADPSGSPDDSSGEQKPVILVVSFGTSYNETRDLTIGAIEEAIASAYPDWEVRRAFTAQTIIDILKDRDGIEIDNVTEAMSRLVLDGVEDVVIQPTHIMPGYEYDDIIEEISLYADKFRSFKVGVPLLSEDSDYDALIAALAEETAEYNTDGTAVVFMGHGTEHDANSVYSTLQDKFIDAGYGNYFVGTVEASPTVDEVLESVNATGASKVVLLPLMIVAGDHATNDMSGDEADSWKSAFENAGYEVECVMKGLGQYKGVQELIIKHLDEAMNSAGPITADMIADGEYEISVESSSSMFKIVKCVLTVDSGSMSAVITMSGDGYGKLFLGTGEEALAASEDDYIQASSDADGAVTFTLPIEALNAEMDCAAWSISKEQWYDRTLVFLSDSIPADAITEE